MVYQFGICGAFDYAGKNLGGQTVKTREFYEALCHVSGKENIAILDSTKIKKHPLLFFIRFIVLLNQCENIVIFPAQNGIRILAPLCALFKGRHKVHYCVIGGWIAGMLREHPSLLKFVKRFDSILVETNVMKEELQQLGFNHVYRLLNFKRLQAVNTVDPCTDPVRLCYFSRVLKEKGIEDAVDAVKKVNQDGIRCTFDIYGPIDPGYQAAFDALQKQFTPQIIYKGVIDPAKSVEVLRNYDLQLFPTGYRTEGIPGSVIDSYFAGVPVIASRWNSFDDVIKDRRTGVGYRFGDTDDLSEQLKALVGCPDTINRMKTFCVDEAKLYSPEVVIKNFLEIVEAL